MGSTRPRSIWDSDAYLRLSRPAPDRASGRALLLGADSGPHRSHRPRRTALLLRFEDQVDPNRQLVPGERRKRAENARKAYYTALALRSAQSRRQAPSTRGAVELDEVEK